MAARQVQTAPDIQGRLGGMGTCHHPIPPCFPALAMGDRPRTSGHKTARPPRSPAGPAPGSAAPRQAWRTALSTATAPATAPNRSSWPVTKRGGRPVYSFAPVGANRSRYTARSPAGSARALRRLCRPLAGRLLLFLRVVLGGRYMQRHTTGWRRLEKHARAAARWPCGFGIWTRTSAWSCCGKRARRSAGSRSRPR